MKTDEIQLRGGRGATQARQESFLLKRFACALSMRTSSLIASTCSATLPICLMTFFGSTSCATFRGSSLLAFS